MIAHVGEKSLGTLESHGCVLVALKALHHMRCERIGILNSSRP